MVARLDEKIAVIGLGYVGLPVAVAFSRACADVTGFDIDSARVAQLRDGHDATGEVEPDALAAATITFSDDPASIAGATLYIVTVPTPVDRENRPDFRPLRSACRMIGAGLEPGATVVFESTVYPGATEEVCGPALEDASGLTCGRDFTLGYSPERINPGDKVNRLESITKIVSGQDAATLERVAAAYEAIIDAEVYRAQSIKVAEAAKVVENTQRDINIALMNELALIFERLDLRTADVLAAAGTKWNFLPFTPGLVGGHCIGVDPYYLTSKAEAVGHHAEVILSGRRINDNMGRFVAQKALKLMVGAGTDLGRARVGLLGMTFKENVPDMRNSKSPDVVDELARFGITALVHDAHASPEEIRAAHGIETSPLSDFHDLDALILVVAHGAYTAEPEALWQMIRPGGVFIDIRSKFTPSDPPDGIIYWSL